MRNHPNDGRRRRSFRLSLAGGIAASSLLSAGRIVSAGTFNWANYAGDNWSDGTTAWGVGGSPSSTDPTTALVFGEGSTPTNYTATDDLPAGGGSTFILNSMTFNTNASGGGSGNITIAPFSIPNVLTFSGNNAAITVNGNGTVTISAPVAYAVNTTVTNNSSNALTLSGTQTFKADVTTTFTGTGNYSIIVGSTTGTSFTFANGETIANGVLSGGQTGSLTLSNGGSYFASSANATVNLANYSSGTFSIGNMGGAAGTVNILAGTITDSNTTGQMFAKYTNLNVASNATFTFSNITDVMGSLSGAGTVNGSNVSLTLDGSGYHDLSGILGISGSGYGSLTIDGSTLVQRLSGTANSYAGTTFVQAGTLDVANAAALGTATSSILVGDVTGALNASLLIDTANVTIGRSITLQTGNTGTMTLGGYSTLTSGTATFSGNITMGSASAAAVPLTLTATSAASVVFSGNLLRASGATGATDTLSKTGSGTVTLQGANTFSGATTIYGGTLLLDYNTVSNATKLSSTGLLTLDGGSLSLSGSATGTSTEMVNGLTLLGGSGRVIVANGNTQSITLALGAITRDGTTNIGTVDFGLPTTGSITTSTSNTAAGAILGAWATVNQTDWAVISGGALAALPAATYTTTFASGDQTSLSAATTTLPTGGGTTNSLRFTGTSALNFTGAADTLTLQSGGVLVSSADSGATSIGASGTAGVIATSGNELIVQQNGSATLTINSVIGGSTRVVKAGPGNLTLAGTNTYTGGTYINGGSVTITAAANLGTQPTTTNPINLNGGSLIVNGTTVNLATSSTVYTPLVIGPAGGTVSVGSSDELELVGSGISGTGTLTKTGAGELYVTSTAATSFTGPIVINQGYIYQSGPYFNKSASNLTIAAGAYFEYYDNGQNAVFGASMTRIVLNGSGTTSMYFHQQSGGTAPLTVDIPTEVNLATTGSNSPLFNVNSNSTGFAPVITITGNVTGPGGFTLESSGSGSNGILYLAGTNNTYAGTTSVISGTLRMDAGIVANGPGVVTTTPGTLDLLVPSNISFAASLGTSTGTFLTEGPGTLTFSTTNASSALSGTLAIVGGGVVLDETSVNTNHLGGTPAMTLGSASLSLNGNASAAYTQTFSGITLTGGGSLVVNAGAGSGANEQITLGAITRALGSGGTVDFNMNTPGSGTATITTTTANTGTGILGGWATVGGSNWAVSAGTGSAAGNITPYASYTTYAGGTAAEPASTADVDFQASNTNSWTTQAINSLRFNTSGTAATLTIASSNTITATTGGILVTPNVGALTSTITGGNLSAPAGKDLVVNQFNTAGPLSIASAIPNVAGTVYNSGTAPLVVASAAGSQLIVFTAGSTSNISVGEIVTGTGIASTSNAHVVAINANNAFTIAYTGSITAEAAETLTFTPNANLVKSGPGQLTLSGTNTFAGVLYANQGVITVASAANLGQSANTGSSSIYLNGGTIELGTGYTVPGAGIQPWVVGPAGGTIQVDASVVAGFDGDQLYGSGPLTKTGLGTMNVGADSSTFSGTITINGGTLYQTSPQLTNAGNVTVNAGGQYEINDNNTASFNFASNSTLTLNGNGPSFGTNTTPGAFDAIVKSGGTTANNTFTNEVFLASDSRVGDWTNVYGTANNIFSGPVIGPGALIKDGPGTLNLSNAGNAWGTSTSLAGTIISNGTLQLGVTNALPTTTTVQFGESASGSSTSNNNSGTLDLASFSQTVAALTTQGTGTAQQIINSVGATPSTLTVNYSGSSADTFAGQIGGGTVAAPANANIALVKTGSGTLVLGGANTYTGATSVNAGGLFVKGSLAAGSTVTVASGAVLSGSGTVNASTSVQSGGTIAASNGGAGSNISPTTLALAGSTTTLHTGSTYNWGLASVGNSVSSVTPSGTAGLSSTWDLLNISNLATGLNGDVTVVPVVLPGAAGAAGSVGNGTYVWDIVQGNGNLYQQFQLTTNAAALSAFATGTGAAGGSLSIIDDTSDNDIAIQYSAAPEPTSFVLTGLAAGGIILRRRRGKNR